MEKMWMKLAALTAICLFFTACGKSKDEASVSNVDKKVTSAPPKTAAPTPSKVPSGKTPQTVAPGAEDGAPKTQQPSATPKTRVVAPKAQQKEEISRQSQDEAKKYSGAASDYLRSFLEVKQDQVKDAQQRERNLKLAASVRSASLKVDYDATGDVALSFAVGTTEKNEKTILLGGTFDENREAKLMGKFGKITVTGSLKCMDKVSADGATCENAIASIDMSKANVKMIFRRTNVIPKAIFPNTRCRTADCENMYSLFRQTDLQVPDSNSLKKAKMESFEIIQGRSGFRLVMVTRGNQVITVGGPLINPEISAVTNIIADRTLKVEDLVDLRTMESYKIDLQTTLNDVRIVGNNGRGKIVLQVMMKVLEDGFRDQFQLDVERVQRDVIPTVEALNQKISVK